MKRVVVTVINDLVTDQRVHRVCSSLHELKQEVLLVGRLRKNSLPIDQRSYQTMRVKLPFEKGFAFYACFNFVLFFKLLFKKIDVLYCNDLDTLFAGYLISKVKSIPLIYDTHEYFTEVPELIDRPLVRKFWLRVEKFLFEKPDLILTVNQSLATEYSNKYQREVFPIRNLPFKKIKTKGIIHEKYKLHSDKKIIIYQGAVNKHRGLEQAIESMKYIQSDALLFVVGDGDLLKDLQTLVVSENLSEKVIFTGAIPYDKLHVYTCSANLGISIELSTNKNYIFSLPNKIFDYIQSQIPVLISDFPETSQLIKKYNIGMILENHDPFIIAKVMDEMLINSSLNMEWQQGLSRAADELCWEEEKQLFNQLISKYVE